MLHEKTERRRKGGWGEGGRVGGLDRPKYAKKARRSGCSVLGKERGGVKRGRKKGGQVGQGMPSHAPGPPASPDALGIPPSPFPLPTMRASSCGSYCQLGPAGATSLGDALSRLTALQTVSLG